MPSGIGSQPCAAEEQMKTKVDGAGRPFRSGNAQRRQLLPAKNREQISYRVERQIKQQGRHPPGKNRNNESRPGGFPSRRSHKTKVTSPHTP